MTSKSHYGRPIQTVNGAATLYSSAELTRIARASVRGLGRYIHWDIRVNREGLVLLAYYKDRDTDQKRVLNISI